MAFGNCCGDCGGCCCLCPSPALLLSVEIRATGDGGLGPDIDCAVVLNGGAT